MILLYLFIILLFGFHAYVIEQEPLLTFEKKEFSEPEGVGLTAADFERGDQIILEPPDENAPFPFENGDVIDPEENEILKKRNSKRGVALNLLWPNKTVPYLVTYGFYDNETALIARAVSEFHRKTCVRWTPRVRETDFVFFGKSNSCESSIGRQGGCQLIRMKPNRCFHFTTLLHEMMHTLGFVHEHQRHDRDQFVKINSANLMPPEDVKDDITDIKSFATDVGHYDYKSVMHYGPYAFSANGLPTIQPVNNNNVIEMGASFSDGDLVEINHVYRCRIRYGADGPIWEDSEDVATE